jgi:hypothetical protein
MDKYFVWFDLLMEDYFAIKSKNMTSELKRQLKSEHVKIIEIFANSTIEAINLTFPKEGRKINNPTFH